MAAAAIGLYRATNLRTFTVLVAPFGGERHEPGSLLTKGVRQHTSWLGNRGMANDWTRRSYHYSRATTWRSNTIPHRRRHNAVGSLPKRSGWSSPDTCKRL